MRSLEIALLPAEALVIDADCYVVIDALRATTTMAVLFARGVRDVVAVDSIETARQLAARDGRMLFGEVEGHAPDGFDHGNSPVEASSASVAGRSAVLFTTNGTQALCALAESGAAVLAGSLTNAGALVEALAEAEDVVIVCAGNEGGTRFAMEDFLTAGEIARLARDANPGIEIGDAARLAIAAASTGNLERRFGQSRHGKVTIARGYGGDIEYAAKLNLSQAVPAMVEYGKGWARLTALGEDEGAT
ncbi:MAG: 2-phosphosulfolactate phosphatase [Dehalococcoidia bacterium]